MISIKNNLFSNEDSKLLQEIKEQIDCQTPISLICGVYSFLIEPCGGLIEIWHCGERISVFKDFDDFILNFKIGEKAFFECLPEIDYN